MGEQTEVKTAKKPRVALWIATGFGLGYLPVAPGTWGSLLGLAAALLLRTGNLESPFLHPSGLLSIGAYAFDSSVFICAIGVAAVAAAGVWASRHAAKYFGKGDPQEIVIDEVSGQMISLLSIGWVLGLTSDDLTSAYRLVILSAPGWKYVVLGFVLFRVFDIVKPWPIRRLEKLPGGWGVMADDWLAGAYAAVVLWFVQRMNWLG